MKTYRNHHTRNRTRRRGMKGGSHAEDLALITKYSDIGARVPFVPLDMRPTSQELTDMERVVKSYPVSEDLKNRFLTTVVNVGKTANRGAGYGQQIKLPLATRFAGELAELKAVVTANRPAERQANSDFYIPLQRLHRIAFDYSNNLTPADQDKLRANKSQYETVKSHTDGRQLVDQDAANVELLRSITSFVPELGQWFGGLSRLKNVQIAARPAERERLFALLPAGLRASPELNKIFDAYSARIADVFVDLSTSAPLGNQVSLAKPGKPGRKIVEVRPDEPIPQAVAPTPGPPIFGMPRPDVRADPVELLPEASPLAAAPLQDVAAPPARVVRDKAPKGSIALARPAEGVASLASAAAPPLVSPPTAPKVVSDYVSPAGLNVERKQAPIGAFPALPVSPRAVPVPSVYNTYPAPPLEHGELKAPGEVPMFSLFTPDTKSTPATALTQQLTPDVPGLKSEEQKAFEKGSYASIDKSKSVCERKYPTVYSLLESGKFNRSDIVGLLDNNDPKVLDLFTVIGYDREAKTIMGHPLAEVYKACHPDRGVQDQQQLTQIFQVLKALERFTGTVQPRLSLPSILKIASKAASQPGGPGSKSEKPGSKAPLVSPTGDLSGVFKRGDRLRPRAIITDQETGQSVILAVVGDYDPQTKTIEVAYRGQTQSVTVDELAKEFQVIKARVQKRLYKKGDRVLVKNPNKLKAVDRARGAVGCDEPFYATVVRDQEPSVTYVSIQCDKGDRYSTDDGELIYIPPGPPVLSRTAAPVAQQPAPVAPLGDSAAPPRRGELRGPGPSSELGAPASMTECDRKLIGMTHRATTCEADLAKLRAELDKAIRENQADTVRLQAVITAEQQRLASLQSTKDQIDADLAALRKKKNLMQGHLNDFGGQLKVAERVKSDLEIEKAKLEAQVGVLEAEKADSESQNEISVRRLAELRRQYEEMSRRLEASSREQATLRGQFAEAEAQLREAEAGVADLNTRFATTDALIKAADESIRGHLDTISGTLTDGIEQITDGISYVAGLADDTRSEIAKSRADFTKQFRVLQRELASSELARRSEILESIRSLKEENQQGMAALQRELAATSAEKDRLQGLFAQEQASKAQMEGQLTAKNEEIARKDREHAEALQAARQAATDTAQQVQAANQRAAEAKDAETAAEASRIQLAYGSRLDELSNRLAAAVARAQVAEENNGQREALIAELARVNAMIAAIPPPYVPPPAPVAPTIIRREPAGDVRQGDNIQIIWQSNGTPAPWILRIDYGGANPDFQEVTTEGPIPYTVKRPGALSGRIYSVTVV